jgi:hypothetical protein
LITAPFPLAFLITTTIPHGDQLDRNLFHPRSQQHARRRPALLLLPVAEVVAL